MAHSKICFLLVFLLFLIQLSCSNGKRADISADVAKHNSFQKLIDSVVTNNDSVVGIIMHLECSGLNISWTGAAGYDDVKKKSLLQENQPFRIASITKTFVATAILRLYEEGRLSLNDSIGKYLSKVHMNLLRKDSYITHKITIKHLLNHTNGISDYAMSDLYFKKIAENPTHWWTRTEQLEIAAQAGGQHFTPGEQFYYSDTGYILLGEIIESVTGKTLAESLRELIGYNKLGLNSTWMESVERKPKGLQEIVHPYFNGDDYYSVSPSIDLYGGGGLVSTVTDLSIFYKSLFEGQIFKRKATLDTMIKKTLFPMNYKPVQDYRMGVQVIEIDGLEMYYHTGIWGSIVAYLPEFNASVAINFTKNYDPSVLVKSLTILKKLNINK